MQRFTKDNFHQLCDLLVQKDETFRQVIADHGYPPWWVRSNSFDTLVLTILEQQVSLASAYAAYKKLKAVVGRITPQKLLDLSDETLRACYFSRQKIVYARELAQAILAKRISLKKFHHQPDADVRVALKKLKGIGDWTVDVYLMHSLRRTDIFPLGDLALVNALRTLKQLPAASKQDLLDLSEAWKPYRSIASMICWHYYIKKKNIKLVY